MAAMFFPCQSYIWSTTVLHNTHALYYACMYIRTYVCTACDDTTTHTNHLSHTHLSPPLHIYHLSHTHLSPPPHIYHLSHTHLSPPPHIYHLSHTHLSLPRPLPQHTGCQHQDAANQITCMSHDSHVQATSTACPTFSALTILPTLNSSLEMVVSPSLPFPSPAGT